ncbi:glycosyltransferase involved in cell wall biosynthesis [Crossiella equi]|uniref:Glycosyltransferase involved in cell wall biosynthesis n=1 Tax=Crossiella equi TaxID=130796 RepID=A0ABS5A5P9_9PSEU|nr:glycosyltransferase family 4 protein [Crossiella equi]MBP2471928.1 glycosyltransferase involved in cell wall biosynthesis [Crossiella equi]
MTVRIGVHFIRRRILTRALRHGGEAVHSSVFRCAKGFEALCAQPEDDGVDFHAWDEREPVEDFVARSDVLVGIPDIRLLNARDRAPHRPPYLALVMGDATRALPWRTALVRRFGAQDTFVCSCSADTGILRLFLEPPEESSVDTAPMPSLLEQFLPTGPPDPAVTRALAGFAPERPVVLSAERMKPEKGVHHVVSLAGYLREHGHDPVLVLLSAGQRTPYQLRVEQQVMAAGLTGSTVLLPFLDARGLATAYQRASFVVSASTIYDNNFGYVPIESQLVGTPPVVADWGGYRDSVLDGRTGVHMPTTLHGDGAVTLDWEPAAVTAEAMLRDPARYRSAVAAGKAHIEANYSLAAARRRYTELAHTALARPRGGGWGISELGWRAVESGWTDQSDNPDRTGRRQQGSRGDAEARQAIHQLIYARYVTHSTAARTA